VADAPHVLVLSAYAGEPQRPRAEHALRHQKGVVVSQRWIEGLGLDEAMGEVHRRAHAASDVSWVLKMDGDMVPTQDDALRRLVDLASDLRVDRLTTPVQDFYTGRQISGIHLLRQGAVPALRHRIDHRPDAWLGAIDGRTLRRVRWPVIDHAPDADTAQAVRFGLQRSTKAVIDGPHSSHWSTLASLLRHTRRSGHPSLWAASFGAWVGLGHHPHIQPDRSLVDRGSPQFQQLVDEAASADVSSRLGSFRGRRAILREHWERFGDQRQTARTVLRHLSRNLRPWIWPPPRAL